MTMQLLSLITRKILVSIWNLVTKTSKIRNVTLTFKNFQTIFQNVKRFWKIKQFIWNEEIS